MPPADDRFAEAEIDRSVIWSPVALAVEQLLQRVYIQITPSMEEIG